MATASDVATFILQQTGPTSAMKLQKLVYYCQAWHAVWSDAPLFNERIEAWAHGPVVPALYEAHRGEFVVNGTMFSGNPDALSDDEKDSVLRVIEAYGEKSSQWLSDLTHMEDPWRRARVGVADGDRCNNRISLESMSEYYSAL